jgi:hypothetical protein
MIRIRIRTEFQSERDRADDQVGRWCKEIGATLMESMDKEKEKQANAGTDTTHPG